MIGNSRTRIAFSTLACPDWTLEQAADAARRYGYDGLELRLLDGELLDPWMPREQRDRVRRVFAGDGPELAAVDTSVKLTADGAGVDADLARWCEVAAEWGAPMFRVFGGEPPNGLDMATATARAAERLNTVAPHARRCGVRVVLETHDAFAAAGPVADIMSAVDSPAIAVLWDSNNPHRMGDAPDRVWELLGRRVAHVHVKDTRPNDEGARTPVLLGDGDVPNQEILSLLAEQGYRGWLSVEWEKKWHPEIDGPDIALPQHIALLRRWLSGTELR